MDQKSIKALARKVLERDSSWDNSGTEGEKSVPLDEFNFRPSGTPPRGVSQERDSPWGSSGTAALDDDLGSAYFADLDAARNERDRRLGRGYDYARVDDETDHGQRNTRSTRPSARRLLRLRPWLSASTGCRIGCGLLTSGRTPGSILEDSSPC